MAQDANQEWLLVNVPGKDAIKTSDFELRSCDVPVPSAGELLVELLYASVDPSHRASMRGDGYNLQAVGNGSPMSSRVVARVVDSRSDDFAKGDVIVSRAQWRRLTTGKFCVYFRIVAC